MRIGNNPNKAGNLQTKQYVHQVIIPVYIPNHEGFYEDSFDVFKLCVQSLINTTTSKTYITIINNGSSQIVADYLNDLKKDDTVSELIHTTNIGKINAVLKGIVGFAADIITVSDQDILFKENWQEATFEVFNDFENVGVVGLIPMQNSYRSCSQNILFDYLFSTRLKFTTIRNPRDKLKFYESIWGNFDTKLIDLEKHLTLQSPVGSFAVIGEGHVVASYRKSIFDTLKKTKTQQLCGGLSDANFLDIPPLKKGYYRFTTADNYAYHMGNVLEKWMFDYYESIKIMRTPVDVLLLNKSAKNQTLISLLYYHSKKIAIKKILFNVHIFKIFSKFKNK